MEYSQFEYEQHLEDPDWTSHETMYLFDLLREYDLRFVIAADRYAYTGNKGEGTPRPRSIEVRTDGVYRPSTFDRVRTSRTGTTPFAVG